LLRKDRQTGRAIHRRHPAARPAAALPSGHLTGLPAVFRGQLEAGYL